LWLICQLFVKKCRSKNEQIIISFLRYVTFPQHLHLGYPRGYREDVHMKRLLLVVAAGALSMLSFSASAEPQQLMKDDTGQLRPSGTVSVSGADDFGDLQAKLAEKAQQEGAKGYVVNSASGDNKMFGTATIYK
jgi:MqsR-controlled colanic acid and biofilm protein A